MQPVIYAVGDVHGEADRLERLHEHIFEHHALVHSNIPMVLVHLGDYVDRGPDSCRVIDYLKSLKGPKGARIISLKGNHEAMMLDALKRGKNRNVWLTNGGDATMESYQAEGYDTVPDAHLDWLNSLPDLHVEKSPKLIFVHAGIDVLAWPERREDVHLWTRSPKFFKTEQWTNPALEGWSVIHGHTPTDDFYPETAGASARRINLDTGACFGGRLTAAKFYFETDVKFIYS